MPVKGRKRRSRGASRRRLGRLTDPLLVFPLLAVLFLAVLWVATLSLARAKRASAEDAVEALTGELLDTYEAQVVRVLREIDHTLKLLQHELEHAVGPGVLAALEARGLLPPALVFDVRIFDRDGALVESNGTVGASVPAREDYTAARAGDGLVIGAPEVDADSGEWEVNFSRPLRDARGAFGGLASVAVESAFFVSGYEPAKLGERGVLAVLGTDGVFRAARTGDAVFAGQAAARLAALDAEGAVIREHSPWDGEERFTSARLLYGFPLAVIVGTAVDEALAPAAREVAAYWRRAAAASVLLVGIVAVLGRMSWQLQRIRHREYAAKVAHVERVEHLAGHDALTGLPNRSLFSRLLEQAIRMAARRQSELAVLFIDLDRFKQINDTLGHEAGDDLLREVARRLRSCLRESDSVARLGGDEFVVLLSELTAAHDSRKVAEKILGQIALPFNLLGQDFRITGSIGISVYPKDGLDEQTLTKNADIAMYQAKQQGKNNFQFYSEEINKNSLERLALESSLRRALECGEFDLRYQARRDARSGRIKGMEALLRWEHPELATIAPRRFLALAEETGLIVPIGRWVLGTACRQNVSWQGRGLPRLPIAVNLSERQFFDEGLVRDVRAALDESGMDAELLELEVAEDLLMHDLPGTRRVLSELKALGVRIVVDQFGVGYSSLTRLERLPLDSIKIDGSFVHQVSEASAGFTDAVVALGRTLSLTVVGQGVETDEQATFLREHGCDELQGFHVHRPMRPQELEEVLREHHRDDAPGAALGGSGASKPAAVR